MQYFMLIVFAAATALFVGMLACLELGRWIGARRLRWDPDGGRAGVGVVEAAVFGLLALLVGFTFSEAAQRFDHRRELIIEEVNAIGTAWLRIDLLPTEAQPAIRDAFRRYLDARLAAYRRLPDVEAAMRELDVAARAKTDI